MTVNKKGWHFVYASTGKCYTFRNVIFDEASLWLPSNKEILSDSNVLKDVLDSSHVQLSLDEAEAEAKKDTAEKGLAQNSWQIGVYQQQSEADELRNRKFNPNYANTAIVDEEDETEPTNLEEAFKNLKWIKATKEEIDVL